MNYLLIIIIFAALGFIFGALIYFAQYKINQGENRRQKDKNHHKKEA